MTTRTVRLLVLCGFLVAGVGLQAHHSVAGVYDLHKEVVLVGELKKLNFTNPHSSIELTVKNQDGTTTEWNLVTASTTILTRQGLNKTAIKPGDILKVTVLPARNGNPLGYTLVLDSIAFTDATWLARGGFFHSDRMRVVEKLTRKGNEILYEVTVEDPEVLVEPWVMTPRTLRLSPNPDAGLLPERANCSEVEKGEAASQIRH